MARGLITVYNAAEARQALRRAAIFDALALLGVADVAMLGRSLSFAEAWASDPGGWKYERHRERFVVGGDATLTITNPMED